MKIIIFIIMIFMSVLAHSNNDINIERLQYQNNASKIKSLTLKNLYGNIKIIGTKQDNITYHAVSQYSENHRAKLISNDNNGDLTLEIIYTIPPAINSIERVDVALIVPKHIKLDIQIEKGNLTTKNISNETKARSNSSNLSIKTSNTADLFTKKGNIQLSLIPHKKKNKSLLMTHEGNVTINYHYKQTPLVKVISGGVTTSNSINLLNGKKTKQRETTYHPNKTFGQISIQTDTGNIQLIEIEQL